MQTASLTDVILTQAEDRQMTGQSQAEVRNPGHRTISEAGTERKAGSESRQAEWSEPGTQHLRKQGDVKHAVKAFRRW